MTQYHDLPYIKLVKDVLTHGIHKTDRTGVGTKSVFGRQMTFDLSDGTIPLLTTKKMHWPSIIHELLWYISGSGNVKYLQENGVRIWNEWADENGDLGPVYGVQWRAWQGKVISAVPAVTYRAGGQPHDVCDIQYEYIDQLAQLVENIKHNPDSRRLMVSAWNVGYLQDMALPPCHFEFQCWTEPMSLKERVYEASKRWNVADMFETNATPDVMHAAMDSVEVPRSRLSMMLNMRSNDVGLGNPFNIAQYSILLRMLCEVTNCSPGKFTWTGGDTHIYTHNNPELDPLLDHVPMLLKQIKLPPFPSPTMSFARKITNIDDFKFEDFVLHDYTSHPGIKMKVAV